MPHISNIQLTVSVIGGGSVANKAEVNCVVNFSNDEVIADQDYYVIADLWETDGPRDKFVMRPNGRVLPLQYEGDPDDVAGVIEVKQVRPNGHGQIDVTLSREWTFPELDDTPPPVEKFFATVSVVPLLAMGYWSFSPVVDVDVG